MGKIEWKKYPRQSGNYVKRTADSGEKTARTARIKGFKSTKQTSAEARIPSLETQLGISSQPEEGDVKNKEETSK